MDMPLPARANLRCLHNEDTSLVVFTGMFVIIRREQRDGGINKVYFYGKKEKSTVLGMPAITHREPIAVSVHSVTRAASASQNVIINISHDKPEGWPPCWDHKLNHYNRAS